MITEILPPEATSNLTSFSNSSYLFVLLYRRTRMLTTKQLRVFDFIADYTHKNKVAPTLRTIQQHVKLASAYEAFAYVERICKRGYLKKIPGKHQGIAIVKYPLGAILPNTQTVVEDPKTNAKVKAAFARGVKHQRALQDLEPENELAKQAYSKGYNAGKRAQPKTIEEAYQRGFRAGKSAAAKERLTYSPVNAE